MRHKIIASNSGLIRTKRPFVYSRLRSKRDRVSIGSDRDLHSRKSVSWTNTPVFDAIWVVSLFTSLCPTVPCSVLPSFDSKKEPAFLSTSNASVAMSCAHKKDRPPGKLFRELLQLHPLTLVFFFHTKTPKEKKRTRESPVSRAYFFLCVCTMLLS